MKRIRGLTGPTPRLKGYLADAGAAANWKEFRKYRKGSARIELVEALTSLQRGLCAYCEIDLRRDDRQIEHFVPVSHSDQGRKRALDSSNLLASCQGGSRPRDSGVRDSGRRSLNLSCDRAKKNTWTANLLDPRTIPACPALFRVRPDGRIEADESGCERAGVPTEKPTATIEILNLNAPRLRSARRRIWEGLSDLWAEELARGRFVEAAIRGELLPTSGGKMDPYFTTRRSFFRSPGAETLTDRILGATGDLWI